MDEEPNPQRPKQVLTTVVLACVVVGFAAWFYRSMRAELDRVPQPPAATADVEVSEGERQARVMRETFRALAWGLVEDLQADRYREAYARMATGYRSGVDVKRFSEALRSNAWIRGAKEVKVRRVSITEGTARLEAVLHSASGNVECVASFTHERGAWAFTGLTLGGTPVLPGP